MQNFGGTNKEYYVILILANSMKLQGYRVKILVPSSITVSEQKRKEKGRNNFFTFLNETENLLIV